MRFRSIFFHFQPNRKPSVEESSEQSWSLWSSREPRSCAAETQRNGHSIRKDSRRIVLRSAFRSRWHEFRPTRSDCLLQHAIFLFCSSWVLESFIHLTGPWRDWGINKTWLWPFQVVTSLWRLTCKRMLLLWKVLSLNETGCECD